MNTRISRTLQAVRLNVTSASTKFYFVFICITFFSALLYVIFINKLDSIGLLQRTHTASVEPVEKYSYFLKQGTTYLASQLNYTVYENTHDEQAWENIRRQEIDAPLDSLRVLVAKNSLPEASLVFTSLKLSLYHYNKLIDEALYLNKQASLALAAKNYPNTDFIVAQASLQKKIREEINPQIKEIHAQLQDIIALNTVSKQRHQEEVQAHIYTFKIIILAILLGGGVTAFLLMRSLDLDLIGNRKALKTHMEKLQNSYEEILQSRQRVRDREARLKGVINNTQAGILAIDKQYAITVANNNVKQYLTFRGIEIETGSSIETLLENGLADWKPYIDKVFAGETLIQNTSDLQADIFTDTCFNPIRDEDGQVTGVAILIQDVSEQKRKENQIRQLLDIADLNTQQMQAQETILIDNLNEMQLSQEQLLLKEANLRALVNNTDDKIISIDTSYRIITCNTALQEYCSRFNIQVETGTDIRKIFTQIPESGWKPHFERAFSGEKFILSNIPGFLDESTILEISYNPIQGHRGRITGICLFMRDITQHVKAEHEKEKLYLNTQESAEELQAQQEELRQNLEELMSTQEELEKTQMILRVKEARLRALINNTPDAIFSLDTHFHVTVLNLEMKKLYEKRYAPIKEGDDFLKALTPAGKKQWATLLDRALGGEAFTSIWEDTADESIVYHELSFNPVKTDSEDIIGVSVFIKDITQRNKQELERQNLLEEAAEKEEELMSQQEVLRDNLQELMQVRDELESKEAQLSSQINAINKSNNILEFDLDGNIINANDNFLKLIQYTSEEIIGKNYQIFIAEEDLELPANLELWNKLKKGEFCTGEFRRLTKNANFLWIKATYNPVLNAQGKPYKIIKFAYDITDRVMDGIEKKRLYERISKDAEELRMQEEELRQNLEELKVTQEALVQQKEFIQDKEARLRALIDNTEDDIYAIDTSYKIIVLNKSVQTRYAKQGLSLQLGYNIFSIIPQGSTAYWKVNFDKAISGEKFSIVDQVTTKDGDVYFDVSLNPIRNDKNQVIGVSVLSRNINHYKMAEKENLQTIDILRKIQEKVASMNNDKEKEIESYKKKVEKLRSEMNGNIKP